MSTISSLPTISQWVPSTQSRELLVGKIRLRREAASSSGRGRRRFSQEGAPWVYSNELERADTSMVPGSWVSLEGPDGKALAYGQYNPHSLIAFRVFQRGSFISTEAAQRCFEYRMDQAWQRRLCTGAIVSLKEPSGRLCFGESDGVPGLVVDLFESGAGPFAVVQCHSAGADGFLPWLIPWLQTRLSVSHGVIRHDLDVRKGRENLPADRCEVKFWGQLPREAFAREGSLKFLFDPLGGQKTGFFYDHRQTRLRWGQLFSRMEGSRESRSSLALDAFCYVGAWGIGMAKSQKDLRVVCVDDSSHALGWVQENARLNGVENQIEVVKADFFHWDGGEGRFQAVVCDPPSMSHSAKDQKASLVAHERCFKKALQMMRPGGWFAFAACSYHLSFDDFLMTIQRAGRHRGLTFLDVSGQATDHPVLGSLPETRYLKAAWGQELVDG